MHKLSPPASPLVQHLPKLKRILMQKQQLLIVLKASDVLCLLSKAVLQVHYVNAVLVQLHLLLYVVNHLLSVLYFSNCLLRVLQFGTVIYIVLHIFLFKSLNLCRQTLTALLHLLLHLRSLYFQSVTALSNQQG